MLASLSRKIIKHDCHGLQTSSRIEIYLKSDFADIKKIHVANGEGRKFTKMWGGKKKGSRHESTNGFHCCPVVDNIREHRGRRNIYAVSSIRRKEKFCQHFKPEY
ncbi:uncharacterized protein LOC124183339 [Neodiprion fabricii]|uniref:uncharacterized protein LOC124183339 n=1 Tax=Neodiprion fabricii TaxID=2872261 RepID=UPI001ED91006|nr:uncharacterized protein LOC124183339 [Neodiprion fabricii]